jgi:ABC-type phosphate transport system substrate-binding protein
MKTIYTLFAIVLFAICSLNAEVIIIANSGVAADSISSDAVSKIYLGKQTKWDDGSKIKVSLIKKGPSHDAFCSNLVGESSSKVSKVWKNVIFTGTGTPPKILKTEDKIVAYVAKTKGAIGYIDSGTAHEGVKTLSVG